MSRYVCNCYGHEENAKPYKASPRFTIPANPYHKSIKELKLVITGFLCYNSNPLEVYARDHPTGRTFLFILVYFKLFPQC